MQAPLYFGNPKGPFFWIWQVKAMSRSGIKEYDMWMQAPLHRITISSQQMYAKLFMQCCSTDAHRCTGTYRRISLEIPNRHAYITWDVYWLRLRVGWLLSKVLILLDAPSKGYQCILGLFSALGMSRDFSAFKQKKYWFRCVKNDIKEGVIDCEIFQTVGDFPDRLATCVLLRFSSTWITIDSESNNEICVVVLCSVKINFSYSGNKLHLALLCLMNHFKVE